MNVPPWLCAGACLGLASADEPNVYEFQQPHMGCLFTLKLVAESQEAAESAALAVSQRIEAIEQVCSDYRPDSEISQIVAQAGNGEVVKVSDELNELLTVSEKYWRWSEGAFDVTLGPCTKLWRASKKSLQLPADTVLARALATTGFPKLHFSAAQHTVKPECAGMGLDFGGIGKGYALDAACKLLLTTTPIHHFLLDAAGQVAAIGTPPGRDAWAVAVVKVPGEAADEPRVVLKLRDAHLATSGDLKQKVTIGDQHYAHILDPKTGLGLTYTVQVSVIASDGATADAVAKPLCILEEAEARKKLRSLPNVQARVLRQTHDGTLHVWETEGWQAFVRPSE